MSCARAAPIAAIAAIALGGCGGGAASQNTSASTAKPSAGGTTLKQTATDFKFSNTSPTVKAGTVTIDLVNKGATAHAIEVEGPRPTPEGQGVEEKTNPIQPGQSTKLTLKLTKPGSYDFYCPVDGHKKLGMTGTLTVK